MSLLDVRDLSVDYHATARRRLVRAVDGVGLELAAGETLGLVGESGSGKSSIGNAILGLVPPSAGTVMFGGTDITRAGRRQRRELSQQMQAVFQDPYGTLNPARTVGQAIAEPMTSRGLPRREVAALAVEMLTRVGLPPDAMARYPAQFSGGQRQRIAIARALMPQPRLIICDEPTSALDLSVQAQILNLLLDLQQRFGLSYLFISHDIDVIRHISHRVAVLRDGRVVETGPAAEVTSDPQHQYTRELLAAIPGGPVLRSG